MISDYRPSLRSDFPGYSFGIARTWYGWSYIARRRGPGPGPLIVISSDLAELRSLLAHT